MELSFGKIYLYQGNYQDFVRQKAERVEQEVNSEHKQQQLYKKELAWMRTGAKARTTKQQARINKFTDLKKNLNKLQVDDDIDISLGQQRLGKKVIEIKNGSLDIENHHILREFNLLVQAHDRIGITGINGAGKSSLLNVLAGELPLNQGTIDIGETVRLAYYRQQTEVIPENERMISYLNEVGQNVVDKNGQHISTTQLLEQFLFPRSMHGVLIRKLSGGERRRLYLLKLLMSQPNVLLLDEPTNDLDIGTLTVLEDYLDNFSGTVITVSHDRYFLDKVANKLFIFNGNAQIKKYAGVFTEYLREEEKQHNQKTTKKPKLQVEAKNKETLKKEKTKLTYAEKIEFNKLETKIDQLESNKTSFQEDLMQVSGSDYEKLAEVQMKIDKIDQEIEEKMKRWEYLSQYDQ
uniref:ABC-F family ATP-binding cassette domain-containing protein n=3 Tax=Liquorilactobacillus uvarum TaxID=303240 RepID=UPI0035D066FC